MNILYRIMTLAIVFGLVSLIYALWEVLTVLYEIKEKIK